MDIIPSHKLPAAVVAELSAIGPRHVLARLTHQSVADVYRVPAWYALRGRPCAEPAASERWERVEVDAATHPALAAWIAEDERADDTCDCADRLDREAHAQLLDRAANAGFEGRAVSEYLTGHADVDAAVREAHAQGATLAAEDAHRA